MITKPFTIICNLLCGLAFTLTTFSQTTDYSRWLTEYTIEGKSLKVLRIPEDQAPSHIKMDIASIQRDLDRNRKWYQEGKRTEEGIVIFNTQFIQHRDSSFPIQYYQQELAAFLAYNVVQAERDHAALMERVKHREDSM